MTGKEYADKEYKDLNEGIKGIIAKAFDAGLKQHSHDYLVKTKKIRDEYEARIEKKDDYVLPKDLLGLWEATICEIRGEIKSWDLKGPHVSDYAKGLCDKLEHSMCALAGGPYNLRYSIGD